MNIYLIRHQEIIKFHVPLLISLFKPIKTLVWSKYNFPPFLVTINPLRWHMYYISSCYLFMQINIEENCFNVKLNDVKILSNVYG